MRQLVASNVREVVRKLPDYGRLADNLVSERAFTVVIVSFAHLLQDSYTFLRWAPVQNLAKLLRRASTVVILDEITADIALGVAAVPRRRCFDLPSCV